MSQLELPAIQNMQNVTATQSMPDQRLDHAQITAQWRWLDLTQTQPSSYQTSIRCQYQTDWATMAGSKSS